MHHATHTGLLTKLPAVYSKMFSVRSTQRTSKYFEFLPAFFNVKLLVKSNFLTNTSKHYFFFILLPSHPSGVSFQKHAATCIKKKGEKSEMQMTL